MTDFEALKDALAEKQFEEETLALAIMEYLSKTDSKAYEEILKIFNKNMEHRFNSLIQNNLADHNSQ